jgi:hypothetical protein
MVLQIFSNLSLFLSFLSSVKTAEGRRRFGRIRIEEERSLALQPIYPFRKTAHPTFPSLPSSCLYGSASNMSMSPCA